jgi:YVTN family beta-propeller protein
LVIIINILFLWKGDEVVKKLSFFNKSFLIAAVFGNLLYANISGNVYLELPVNGNTKNSYGVKDANEPGIKGVRVVVTDSNGNSQEVLTDSSGNWSVNLNAPVRVKFKDWPSYLSPTVFGQDSATSVRFLKNNSNSVNFGLYNPSDYIDSANPTVVAPAYANGSGKGDSASRATVFYWKYNQSNNAELDKNFANLGQTGSVWGLAYSKAKDTIYLSAVVRRHVGLGPKGIGAIYKITGARENNATFSEWIDIANDFGIDLGFVDRNSSNRCLALHDDSVYSYDYDGYLKVGKVGLGDIDLSEDETKLYAMDLKNKQVIVIDTQTKQKIKTISINDPGCSNQDYRPWAIDIHNGELYVGVVCSAETSQNRDDLKAYVLKYNETNSNFEEVLSFNLNYPRTHTLYSNNKAPWKPWTTDLTWHDDSHPEPILSDIEFDENGAMILAFIDRYGMMTANNNYTVSSDGTCNQTYTSEGHAGGEILRACIENGNYVLENNGACGGITTSGANTNEGPGGGEYYTGDNAGPNDDGLGITIRIGQYQKQK